MRDYLRFASTHTPAAFWPIIFSLIVEVVWVIRGQYSDAGLAFCFSVVILVAMLIGNRTIYKHFKDND
jgi:hypothetical protein